MSRLKKYQVRTTSGDPYTDLAYAIVISAIKEYKNKFKAPCKTEKYQKIRDKEVRSAAKFLRSPQCDLLLTGTQLTGQAIIEALEKRYKEEQNGKQSQNNIRSDE